MPQIIVAADRGAAFGEGAVMFRERVNVADFESEHFAAQLVERLGWAVEDADRAEQVPDVSEEHADRAEQAPDALGDHDADPIQAAPAAIAEDQRLSVPSPA